MDFVGNQLFSIEKPDLMWDRGYSEIALCFISFEAKNKISILPEKQYCLPFQAQRTTKLPKEASLKIFGFASLQRRGYIKKHA